MRQRAAKACGLSGDRTITTYPAPRIAIQQTSETKKDSHPAYAQGESGMNWGLGGQLSRGSTPEEARRNAVGHNTPDGLFPHRRQQASNGGACAVILVGVRAANQSRCKAIIVSDIWV